MNKETLSIGEYILLWCSKHGVTRRDFLIAVGYSPSTWIKGLNSVSIEKYFAIAEFMAETSQVLPIEFYLKRLKDVLQWKYTHRTYEEDK